jgi:hypothetical protein
MPEDDDIQFIGVPVRHVKREPKESHDGSGISTVYRHHPLVDAPQVEMDNRSLCSAAFHPDVFTTTSECYEASIAAFARCHDLRHIDTSTPESCMTPARWTESQAEQGIEQLATDPFSPRWLLCARASE